MTDETATSRIPHDNELERSILGACMVNPSPENLTALRAAIPDLFNRKHRICAEAILHCADNGGVDALSVVQHLRSTDKIDAAGGAIYIGKHIEWTMRSDAVSRYAGKVRAMADRRRVAEAGQILADAAIEGDPIARLRELAEACSEPLERSGEASRINTVGLAALFSEELEPIPWVIDGLLAEGDILVIGGEPGSGKSVLMMLLALSIASGRSFLGMKAPQSTGPVLYVDEEQNSRLAKRRLRMLMKGLEIDEDDAERMPLVYTIENSINLDNGEHALNLLRLIDEVGPKWIFLDSLVRFHNRDENSNSEMSQFFADALKPMAERVGSGLGILHHLSKPSGDRKATNDAAHRLRGASDIRAMVDQLWALEHDAIPHRRTITHLKNRWSDPHQPVTIEYEEQGDAAMVRGSAQIRAVEDVIRGELQLAGHNGLSRSYIVQVAEAEGYSERLVDKILGKLFHTDQVSKRTDGRAVWYTLTDPS